MSLSKIRHGNASAAGVPSNNGLQRSWPFSSGNLVKGVKRRRLRLAPCRRHRTGHAAEAEC